MPRVFGRYVLFDRIGRGGMANIFLARADTSLGGSRLCVVKQILTELGKDSNFERALIAEAKLAARLTHANVVQVFDLGREGDRLFIAMEYVEGFDLNQLLRALSKAQLALPAEFALFVIREVLRALDYAHRVKDNEGRPLGLVHRDVSPSNVLISFEGEVKLCDFGIARAMSAHDEESEISVPRVVGKSAYMAPEHARGEPIDARADVFAAGILLWELAAGRRLYRGSEEEMLNQAKQAEVPPLPERGLPEQAKLQAVLNRALARYRDDRFQSAAEFLRALEDYAVQARLMASQLRFGSFLTGHFAQEIVELRRGREVAARAYQSEIPPHSADSGEEATGAHHEGARDKARMWSEPGALDGSAPTLDASATLRDAPPAEAARERALGASSVSEAELDRSLLGLDAAAQQGAPAKTPSVPARAASRSEWVWYAAAAAILLLGLLGYVFR
ncbi:MAG: serine/threonine-protein kinase [Myxococcales bacterium]